jgi:AsmA-like protein
VAPSTRPRLMRAARYAAYAVLAFAALIVAAALVLPAFLDMQRVEAELQAKLSQAVHGEVRWEKLEIRLLPTPRGALDRVRIEIPGTASVRAAEVEARLRLLPLLRGRAEVASISLSKPVMEIQIAPSQPGREKPREEPRADPLEAYRSAIEAIRRFAPEAVVDVEQADLDLRIAGEPPLRVQKLDLHARTGDKGLSVEITADSEYWTGFKLSGEVAFSDLSGAATLEVAEARPQAWLDSVLADSPVGVALPAVRVRAAARSDGKASAECDFDLSAPSAEIRRGEERLFVSDVALAGKLAAGREEIALELKGARLGASRLGGGSLRYSLKDRSLAGVAEFDLDLAQAMDGVRRMLASEAGEALAAVDPVAGRARGQVKVNAARSAWNVLAEIRQSDSSIGIKGAPAPVRLAAAAVEATGDAVKIDRAELSMLDARLLASATIGYGRRLRIVGAVSEGSAGENALAWIWKTAELPPHLALKAPVRIAVQRAAWAPKQPLDLEATAQFDAGPSIAIDMGWTPGTLDIRRAAVKDARSDATIALRTKASLIEGKFSGSLQSASLAAALKSGKLPSGGASGELRFGFDRRHPERFSADGRLKGEAIDLAWLLDRPVKIDSVELEAGGGSLRIREAAVNWAEQRFRLRGDVKRGAGGPVIDAQLDSPGVLVDALIPSAETPEEKTKQPSAAKRGASKLWPLPVTGHIAVRSDFVQYGRHKVAPFAATLALEERRAHLQQQQAQLCGISLPLTLDATPEGYAVEAHITARKQQLEETARCLTEQRVLISGVFDLTADLRTRGQADQLARNLEGTVRAESRDGRVMKFALLGNILSLRGVADLLTEGAPKVDSAGFPYRRLSAAGRFAAGRFVIDESAFESSAVGLAATGWISVVDYQSRLSVLVAPFARVDRLTRKVPIVGYIMGGALTSIPVGVSGDIRDPLVVPLGPAAVTSELKGILERTLKLPAELLPQPSGEAPGPPAAP